MIDSTSSTEDHKKPGTEGHVYIIPPHSRKGKNGSLGSRYGALYGGGPDWKGSHGISRAMLCFVLPGSGSEESSPRA